ncbi:hypothetical protein QNF05_004320 [Vibrio alginolyticus]|nr:hypothetical protein [Vibrio alginolyticus]
MFRDFIKKVWGYLSMDYSQFSEREYAWVVSEQIKISSFPLVFTASLGVVISTVFDGNNVYIVNLLKEFVQIETLKVLFFCLLPLLGASIFISVKPMKLVNHVVNWALYWCFIIASTLSAILIGGSFPLIFGLLPYAHKEMIYIFILFFLIVPSMFYGLALLTQGRVKDKIRNWI